MKTVSTFDTMGTTVTVVSEEEYPLEGLAEVEQIFNQYDTQYSTYNPNSELVQVRTNKKLLQKTSPDFQSIVKEAKEWEERTHGFFNTKSHSLSWDLNGLIKAKALEDSAEILKEYATEFSINCGGDIVYFTNHPDKWVTGITNPFDDNLLTQLKLFANHRAIATSGTKERGSHIWSPTLLPPTETIKQATILSPTIVLSDVIATAVVAAGKTNALRLLDDFPEAEALIVTTQGECLITEGLQEQLFNQA